MSKELLRETTKKGYPIRYGGVFSVVARHVEYKDGSSEEWYFIEAEPWVRIVALVDDKILLIREYKASVKKDKWRLPGGRVERDEVDQPVRGAERELREETGYAPDGEMELLLSVEPGASWIRQDGFVYLAKRIKPYKSLVADETDVIDTIPTSINEVLKMCDQTMFDSQTEQALRHAILKIRSAGQ